MPLDSTALTPPAPGSEPDELQTKVSHFITEKWVDLKSAYGKYHESIWRVLLMYAGELWIEYSRDRRMFQRTVPKDEFVPTPYINKFAPAIDAIASNFQQIPEVEAVPTPLDDVVKIGISEVANEVATHFIKDAGLRSDYKGDDDKVGLAGQMFTLAGCFMTNVIVDDQNLGQRPMMEEQQSLSVQCTQCDTFQMGLEAPPPACPNCGNPDIVVAPMPQQQPSVDPLTGEPQMEPMTEKRVRCTVENALYLYPRPTAKTMGDTGWIVIAERASLDEIWRLYGVEAQADSEYPDAWNTTNENALNWFYLGSSSATLSGKDGALVIRMYAEPGKLKDFPEGFYAIYINGKCQKAEAWPFREHPLTKADFKAIPTQFFPRSVAFDLAPIQQQKGEFWSIFTLHAKTTAVDPWIVDEDAQVSEITGRGDKIITYRKLAPDTEPPHHASHGSLDPALYTLDNKLDQEFDNIGQTVAVFRGEQPGSVKAGVALDTLRAQAEFMFSGPVANWNNAWKETVRKAVKLMQKSYTLEQLVAIAGENRISEVQNFIDCDLDTCVEWVASRSGLPRTRDERRQEMVSLYDRGLLDPNDPAVREKAFELFGETGMLGTFNKDATRARTENSLLISGQPAIFMPEVDDNAVHLAIHGDKIKSADFLRLPPEAQQALLKHYMETKQALAVLSAPPPEEGENGAAGPAGEEGAEPQEGMPAPPPGGAPPL